MWTQDLHRTASGLDINILRGLLQFLYLKSWFICRIADVGVQSDCLIKYKCKKSQLRKHKLNWIECWIWTLYFPNLLRGNVK